MPKIFPFRGWYYNPKKVTDLSTVISPPYDVMSESDVQTFQERSPWHFTHVIRNLAPDGEAYKSATDVLEQWIRDKVMIKDDIQRFYLISQTTDSTEGSITRIGLIAAVQLTKLGETILPHEETIPKHIEDRYRLMEATKSQSGQIFMVYEDLSDKVDHLSETIRSAEPLLQFQLDGIDTAVWSVADPGMIEQIETALQWSRTIIADGHHRYKTAWRYYQEHKNYPGADRVMATLVNSRNPGLEILPTHRLIKKHSLPLQSLLDKVQSKGETGEILPAKQIIESWKSHSDKIGIIDLQQGRGFLIVPPKSEGTKLAVEFTHDQILEPVLNLSINKPEDLENLDYFKGNVALDDLPDLKQKFRFLFLVPPPTIEQVFDITRQGKTLPQKSTYFYPKMYSGVITRKLDSSDYSH